MGWGSHAAQGEIIWGEITLHTLTSHLVFENREVGIIAYSIYIYIYICIFVCVILIWRRRVKWIYCWFGNLKQQSGKFVEWHGWGSHAAQGEIIRGEITLHTLTSYLVFENREVGIIAYSIYIYIFVCVILIWRRRVKWIYCWFGNLKQQSGKFEEWHGLRLPSSTGWDSLRALHTLTSYLVSLSV